MSELKPCPFCGGAEVDIGHDGGHEFGEPNHTALCGSCWARIDSGDITCLTEDQAVGMWNRRRADTWIPVGERLPEEPRAYLAWCYHKEYCPHPWPSVQNYYSPEEKWGRDTDIVTHWRPLPEGPE